MGTICNYCLKFNQRELKYTLKKCKMAGHEKLTRYNLGWWNKKCELIAKHCLKIILF